MGGFVIAQSGHPVAGFAMASQAETTDPGHGSRFATCALLTTGHGTTVGLNLAKHGHPAAVISAATGAQDIG